MPLFVVRFREDCDRSCVAGECMHVKQTARLIACIFKAIVSALKKRRGKQCSLGMHF